MIRIMKDLPLFSLIQVSPYLYEKILKGIEKNFPNLIKNMQGIRMKDLEEAAKKEGIVFVKPKSRTVAVALSIIEAASTPRLGVFRIEITFPQFYGEAYGVRKATQEVLGFDGDFSEGRSGVTFNIILGGRNAPVLAEKHGANGNAQKFYVARKEIKQ